MASLPLWEEPDLTRMHSRFMQRDVPLLVCDVLHSLVIIVEMYLEWF